RVAGEIDQDIGIELPYLISELARRFGFRPIDHNLLDALPGPVGNVRLPPLPTDVKNGMAGLHQTRHKERADVPGTADNDNAQREAQTICAAVRSMASICL